MIRRRAYLKRSAPARRVTVKGSRKPLKRSTRVRERNVARHSRNWLRAYHSVERVEFVQTLPCVVTGETPSVNAHTHTGGTGRKAGYKTIIPVTARVHQLAHDKGWAFVFGVTPKAVPMVLAMHAAYTEAQWQLHRERTT